MLITRPEPSAQETARLLAGRGYETVFAPMMVVQPRIWPNPPHSQAVLVTSANALPALTNMDRATPLLAVGDATAGHARAMGFTHVESAGRDAEALAALALERCDPANGSVLLASGAGHALSLAADLRAGGLIVRRRVAYTTVSATELPAETEAALAHHRIGHALFFSAVAARAFVACVLERTDLVQGIVAHAISPRAAQALAPLPWLRIRVASHPNQDELVAQLT